VNQPLLFLSLIGFPKDAARRAVSESDSRSLIKIASAVKVSAEFKKFDSFQLRD